MFEVEVDGGGGGGGSVVVIKAWAVGDKDVRGPERVESWC